MITQIRETGLEIVRYHDALASNWDEFVLCAVNSTFLHTRKFLSYHGNKFEDHSLLIMENGELKAVLPAATSSDDPQTVISHPGITYGGLIHDGSLSGDRMLSALSKLCNYYKQVLGFKRLQYKAVPWIYHRQPTQDDIYAMFVLNAQRIACDLSSTIDLQSWDEETIKRRPEIKKAAKTAAICKTGIDHAEGFWSVLSECLLTRHNANPVHSLEEFKQLTNLFPDEIELVTCWLNDKVVSGAVLFFSQNVCHVQYLASNDSGRLIGGIDLVIKHCIEIARAKGLRYFDFGKSTEQTGRYLNAGLYKFKSDFGAGGTLYEAYEL
ncbi:MAG: GNAT family N-acetyltransferase [Candidatus Obscuribacterales bacterium]|nr:GNAT family N-acetyltransferase [Candidatus Obscuribacterales bacterium]